MQLVTWANYITGYSRWQGKVTANSQSSRTRKCRLQVLSFSNYFQEQPTILFLFYFLSFQTFLNVRILPQKAPHKTASSAPTPSLLSHHYFCKLHSEWPLKLLGLVALSLILQMWAYQLILRLLICGYLRFCLTWTLSYSSICLYK